MTDQREQPAIIVQESTGRSLCFQMFVGFVTVALLVLAIVCAVATSALARKPEMALLSISILLSSSVWLFTLWWYKSGVLGEKLWLVVSVGLAALFQALVSAVFGAPCPANHTSTTAAPVITTTHHNHALF